MVYNLLHQYRLVRLHLHCDGGVETGNVARVIFVRGSENALTLGQALHERLRHSSKVSSNRTGEPTPAVGL